MHTDEHGLKSEGESPLARRPMRARGRFLHILYFPLALSAQTAPAHGTGTSLPEALEAIQRARVVTRILYITAHPDDEVGALLPYLGHGLCADVALLTLTRGEGGQNAIGPELGPQLAAIRSAELLAATRVYGVRLFFTRAPDFGYSKTLDETLRIWGEPVLGDIVRVIRTFRPHVVIDGWGGVRGGHGNHQASGYLTPKAFEAAADPNAFPEQLAEGLKPWRASLLVQPLRGESSSAAGWVVPADQISPLWGKSYREISMEALVNHRSQGFVGFLNSPFLRRSYALLAELTPFSELSPSRSPAASPRGAFEPALLAEPLRALAGKFSAYEAFVRPALEEADAALAAARQAALELNWAEAIRALAGAGHQIVEAKAALASTWADQPADLQWELDRVRERIDAALEAAAGVALNARADRSEVVAGENFSVRVQTRWREDIPAEVGKPELVLPAGWSVTKEETEASGAVRFTVAVPAGAEIPHPTNEWMLPAPPPLMWARVRATTGPYAFAVESPVVAQRITSTRADTLPVTTVPAVTLVLEPRQFLLSVGGGAPARPLELLARVRFYGTQPARIPLGLDAPAGWKVEAPGPVEFSGAGDELVRFRVTPPARLVAGDYKLSAWAEHGGQRFATSVAPLPSLPTRQWHEPAVAAVHVLQIAIPAGLRVGYIAAENDPIPDALARLASLGLRVDLLDPVALAFDDLKKYDAIVVGIRAYELRADVARANARLLDYVRAGGTLVVQYQRENVWNSLKPAPFPATGSGARITDENAPVRFLAPAHALLNFPNQITLDDFKGWVQERGLYFWSQFDPQYQPVLGLRDPGEEEILGGLLLARLGKGAYIYTGLSFFRQLPEGVPGAVRLFVNLLSATKLPATPAR